MRWPRPNPEARPGLHFRPPGAGLSRKTSPLIPITLRMSEPRDQACEANRIGVGMRSPSDKAGEALNKLSLRGVSQLSPFEPPQHEERTSPAHDCRSENVNPSELIFRHRRFHARRKFGPRRVKPRRQTLRRGNRHKGRQPCAARRCPSTNPIRNAAVRCRFALPLTISECSSLDAVRNEGRAPFLASHKRERLNVQGVPLAKGSEIEE
jgi:hypothetical protein